MPIYQGNMQSETNQSLIERAASRINPAIAYGPRVEASEPENDGIDLRELWRVIVNRRGTIIFYSELASSSVGCSLSYDTHLSR